MARFVVYKEKKDVPMKYKPHCTEVQEKISKKWKIISILSIGINLAFLIYTVLTTIRYG